MELSALLIALLACPLAFTLVMAALPKETSRSLFAGLHLVSMTAVLVLSILAAGNVLLNNEPINAIGLWFHLDSLGAIFVLLIGVIGFLTGVFSLPYVKHDVLSKTMDEDRVKQYYALFSMFVFTMLLATTTNNIILMWAAVEATTLSTVFLVGIYRNDLCLEASWKYAIVCTAGVAFGLFGTLLVYANAADIMANPHEAAFLTSILPYAGQLDPQLMKIAFVFVVIGFGTKAGLFPMHTWLPDAHSQAPSPVSALLSGVLLKCAILIIIRFYMLTIQTVGSFFPQLVMLIVGALSVVMAALSLVSQPDLKRRFAYSSVENVGIIAVCLGFGGPLGVAAALLHCVFHGFTKSLLFCLSGNILMKYGTRDLRKITGVIEVMPVTATLMIIGLFALAGFPPLAMFISEFLMFVSGVASGYLWLVIVIAIALTVVIAVIMTIVSGSILRKAPAGMKKGDVSPLALIPEIVLLLVVIWFGVATPRPLIQGVENSCAIILQEETDELHEAPLYRQLFGTETSTPEIG